MNTVEYYKHSQTVIVYLDRKPTDKIDALNEATKTLLREVVRCEHGFNSDIDR